MEHVKDKESSNYKEISLEVAAMSHKMSEKAASKSHRLLERKEASKQPSLQVKSGEQNKGGLIQQYASSKLVQDVFDDRSRIERRTTTIRQKVGSQGVTKDTYNVEDIEDEGAQASQPRHN